MKSKKFIYSFSFLFGLSLLVYLAHHSLRAQGFVIAPEYAEEYTSHHRPRNYQAPDIPKKDIIDMHFHTACTNSENECYVSDSMRDKWFGIKFAAYVKSFGLSKRDLKTGNDIRALEYSSELVRGSKYVAKAVVLALDGVYDKNGDLDQKNTQVVVSNKFVQEGTAQFDNLLFGASINPKRKNALQILEQAKADGAVLVKWIPCTMHFDPSDKGLTPFYEKMRELNLPLLSHVGHEGSFANSRDEFCDPSLLELPLSLGVTVIAAHMASRGEYKKEQAYDRLAKLWRKYPNLYADNSATLLHNRPVDFLRKREFATRVVYGSDFPLNDLRIGFFKLQRAERFFPFFDETWRYYIGAELTNSLDKDVAVKKAMGVPEESFYLLNEVIGED